MTLLFIIVLFLIGLYIEYRSNKSEAKYKVWFCQQNGMEDLIEGGLETLTPGDLLIIWNERNLPPPWGYRDPLPKGQQPPSPVTRYPH